MIAAAPEPEDSGTSFAEPLPYIHHFNEGLKEHGHEPVFSEEPTKFQTYDVLRPLDFRGWDHVPGMMAQQFDKSADVPESRIRVIGEKNGKLIHECYERIERPIVSTDLNETIRLANQPRDFYWKVTYRVHNWESECTCPSAKLQVFTGDGWGALFHEDCGAWRKSKALGNFGDHVKSLNLGMPDEEYNGFYPNLPGNDIAHLNPNAKGMDVYRGGDIAMGQVPIDNMGNAIGEAQAIRGGREIRGGRAEHREATKGMIAWDAGTQRDLDKIKAEKKEKQIAANRKVVEKMVNAAPRDLFDV